MSRPTVHSSHRENRICACPASTNRARAATQAYSRSGTYFFETNWIKGQEEDRGRSIGSGNATRCGTRTLTSDLLDFGDKCQALKDLKHLFKCAQGLGERWTRSGQEEK